MDGEAGWWTASGIIGLPPPLARVVGVDRQQQQLNNLSPKPTDGDTMDTVQDYRDTEAWKDDFK